MKKLRNLSYLTDILDASKKIQIIVGNITFEVFEKDLLIPLAVARLLEIIGEATKNLSTDLRENNTQIPWKAMAGLRDVLIHRYNDANEKRIYEISKDQIPNLIKEIDQILSKLK